MELDVAIDPVQDERCWKWMDVVKWLWLLNTVYDINIILKYLQQ